MCFTPSFSYSILLQTHQTQLHSHVFHSLLILHITADTSNTTSFSCVSLPPHTPCYCMHSKQLHSHVLYSLRIHHVTAYTASNFILMCFSPSSYSMLLHTQQAQLHSHVLHSLLILHVTAYTASNFILMCFTPSSYSMLLHTHQTQLHSHVFHSLLILHVTAYTTSTTSLSCASLPPHTPCYCIHIKHNFILMCFTPSSYSTLLHTQQAQLHSHVLHSLLILHVTAYTSNTTSFSCASLPSHTPRYCIHSKHNFILMCFTPSSYSMLLHIQQAQLHSHVLHSLLILHVTAYTSNTTSFSCGSLPPHTPCYCIYSKHNFILMCFTPSSYSMLLHTHQTQLDSHVLHSLLIRHVTAYTASTTSFSCASLPPHTPCYCIYSKHNFILMCFTPSSYAMLLHTQQAQLNSHVLHSLLILHVTAYTSTTSISCASLPPHTPRYCIHSKHNFILMCFTPSSYSTLLHTQQAQLHSHVLHSLLILHVNAYTSNTTSFSCGSLPPHTPRYCIHSKHNFILMCFTPSSYSTLLHTQQAQLHSHVLHSLLILHVTAYTVSTTSFSCASLPHSLLILHVTAYTASTTSFSCASLSPHTPHYCIHIKHNFILMCFTPSSYSTLLHTQQAQLHSHVFHSLLILHVTAYTVSTTSFSCASLPPHTPRYCIHSKHNFILMCFIPSSYSMLPHTHQIQLHSHVLHSLLILHVTAYTASTTSFSCASLPLHTPCYCIKHNFILMCFSPSSYSTILHTQILCPST